MSIRYTLSAPPPAVPPVHGELRVGGSRGDGDLELWLNGVHVLSIGNTTGTVYLYLIHDSVRGRLPQEFQTPNGKLKVSQ